MSEFQNELTPRRGRPPLNREALSEAPVVSPAAEPARRVTRERKPFGAFTLKMAYPDREGFHRHWFNDWPGRVERALEAGYEHVKGNDGKNVSRVVGVAEGGGPLHAFLMEIPEEWYKEDMKREQELVDEKEASIKRGLLNAQEGDGRYIPQQGIKIDHGSKA